MKKALADKGIIIPPLFCDRELLKFIQATKFDMGEKALTKIDNHFKWLAASPIVAHLDTQTLKILNAGAFYIGGRDKYFRPTIFMDGAIISRLNAETPGGLDCTVFGELWFFFY